MWIRVKLIEIRCKYTTFILLKLHQPLITIERTLLPPDCPTHHTEQLYSLCFLLSAAASAATATHIFIYMMMFRNRAGLSIPSQHAYNPSKNYPIPIDREDPSHREIANLHIHTHTSPFLFPRDKAASEGESENPRRERRRRREGGGGGGRRRGTTRAYFGGSWKLGSQRGSAAPGEREREREDAPSSCRAGLLAHDLNYRTPPPRRERKRDRERRREEGRSVDLALVSGFRSARVRWDGGTRLGEVVSRFGMMEYSAMLAWVGLIAIDGLSKAMQFF